MSCAFIYIQSAHIHRFLKAIFWPKTALIILYTEPLWVVGQLI